MWFLRCCQLQSQILIILFWLVTLIFSTNYDLITERFECPMTPNDLCQNTSCGVRLVRRNLTHIEFNCHLSEPANNIMMRSVLFYKFNEYRKFLVDIEENLCDFFDNKKTTLLKTVMPIATARRSLNINKCPAQGDVIVRNLNVNSGFSPPGLPSGRYRVDVYLSSEKRQIAKVKLYLTLKARGAVKLEMG